jgi:3-dehydroquinate synthase
MSKSAEFTKLHVALGERSYDIVIGAGLDSAGLLIAQHLKRKRTFIITDKNVAETQLETFVKRFENAGIEIAQKVVLSPGEETKNFTVVSALVETLLHQGLERSDVIIALGGGVVGDITGFAAAIALRGIAFIQIPTTLLAQVDSSVGGKTGIDTPYGKNTIGAFHQPQLVLIDTNVLDTLPLRELQAGYAEIVKYGAIKDAKFFAWLEANGKQLLSGLEGEKHEFRIEAVIRSCQIKADVVVADEREEGERALLNFGHTFGHALESETGFSNALIHGEGVSIGMAMAARFSAELGFAPKADAERLIAHLKACGLPVHPSDKGPKALDPVRILAHMKHDKKVKDGRITLILLRGIGSAFITREVEEDRLLAFLRNELK